MSVVSLRRSSFNPNPVLLKFKDTSFGTTSLSTVHISSRELIDLYDGSKVPRKEFNTSGQDGYYACESSISFANDDEGF